MCDEPVDYLSVNGIALAFFAVSSIVGLVVSSVLEGRDAMREAMLRERTDDYDIEEALPRYDDEAPPRYSQDISETFERPARATEESKEGQCK